MRPGIRWSTRTARIVAAGLLVPLVALGPSTPAAAAIGDITTYADPEGEVDSPIAVTAGPDGNVWFTASLRVGFIDPVGDITTFELPNDEEDAAGLYDITSGPDGNLWFVRADLDEIGQITPLGDVTTFPDVEGEIAFPRAITSGPDGNVWFVSQDNDRIGRITPAGDIATFTAPSVDGPTRITAGPDGNLWFAQTSAEIGRITPSGDIEVFAVPGLTGRVWEVAPGPDGDVWFTSVSDDLIGSIDPDGTVVTHTHPDVLDPSGIAIGADGNLWFTSAGNDRLGRSTPDGDITTFEGPEGEVDRPQEIVSGPGGDLWFASFENDRLGRIEPTQAAAAPSGLSAAPGDGVVRLSWTAPTDTGGLPLTGYRVLRDGAPLQDVTDGLADELDDHSATNGTTYSYEVRALNDRGEGAGSVVVATPRTVPSPPGSLSASPGSGQAQLSWTAPTDDGGATILRYRIYRDGVQVHQTASSTPTSFTDTGLQDRRTYTYEVAAVNLVGTGQRSLPTTVTPQYQCLASEPAFTDVGVSHPFYADICWMADNGISTGSADGTYRPASPVSRQAMSAFMFRLADVQDFDVPDEATFDDVSASHPFFEEVEWMAYEQVTQGFGDGTYRPSTAVSRGAMSAFLYRLAGNPAQPSQPTPSFSDVSPLHPFYAEVEWMARQDISTGFTDGTYRPSAPVSRQAMSAFMHRFADHPGVGI